MQFPTLEGFNVICELIISQKRLDKNVHNYLKIECMRPLSGER
jgi:hypothetical protein